MTRGAASVRVYYDGAMHLSAEHNRLLLDAARETIRSALRIESNGIRPCPNPALLSPGGCFVSLHELHTHKLRGCVGRLDASQPLWNCIHGSSLGVLEDPRFYDDPVRLSELPNLEIEISVLSPMRQAQSITDFDLSTEGIYLIHQNRSGCFLPQVARETGWNREQLLSRLCTEKMGLQPHAWKEQGAKLMVFSTLVIGPEPFERRAPSSVR
jgi:AmmeMemoRadiSam system protein A